MNGFDSYSLRVYRGGEEKPITEYRYSINPNGGIYADETHTGSYFPDSYKKNEAMILAWPTGKIIVGRIIDLQLPRLIETLLIRIAMKIHKIAFGY